MTENELRKRLRELVESERSMAGDDWAQGRQELAYWRLVSALTLVKLLTDYDEQPDPEKEPRPEIQLKDGKPACWVPSDAASDALRKEDVENALKNADARLKKHHPNIAAWYEKHGKGGKWPVGPVTGGYLASSSVGVHTCYEGCTHPSHEGVPVPPIGTEPLADPDDAHQETTAEKVGRLVASTVVVGDGVTEVVPPGGSSQIGQVWDHYVSAHPDHKTCRLTAPRKRMIQARLKEGYTVEQLKDAITGFHLSPFHTGENEQKKRYLEFELMVRSGEQVEKGLGCLRDARQPGKATGPTEAEIAAQQAEIRATVDAALAQPIPPPEAPPAPKKEEVEFL